MAERAVWCELFSAKFPANREKYREFARNLMNSDVVFSVTAPSNGLSSRSVRDPIRELSGTYQGILFPVSAEDQAKPSCLRCSIQLMGRWLDNFLKVRFDG